MTTYLFKLTIAWAAFLLLFELFFKHNGRFTANRRYLLLTMAAGILLPLITLPASAPVLVSQAQTFYTAAVMPVQQQVSAAAAPVTAVADTHVPDIAYILRILYYTGLAVLLIKSIAELAKIAWLINKRPAQQLYGQQVIITGKVHSPYSFMGRIFITGIDAYSPKELEYIIQHEAAHNARKHWVDLWLAQLVCTAAWFHPLAWRYRFLLLMQHEYEADAIAAGTDRYNYGHFLLQQTMLTGVPLLTHSFHFSPIKKRIYMLTKKQNNRKANWKYFLLAPAMFSCLLLMAKTTANENTSPTPNARVFNGNTFTVHDVDTFHDYQKKTVTKQIVTAMNGETVYNNDELKNKAQFGKNEYGYLDYVYASFNAMVKNSPDSLGAVNINSLVIDKDGKVVYYDATFFRRSRSLDAEKMIYPFPKPEPLFNSFMEKILKDGPAWKPARINGQRVNSFVMFRGGC